MAPPQATQNTYITAIIAAVFALWRSGGLGMPAYFILRASKRTAFLNRSSPGLRGRCCHLADLYCSFSSVTWRTMHLTCRLLPRQAELGVAAG
jgi:hypothetical protein